MKKTTLLGGHVFNLRLFLEGLKRLRVVSMVVGILTVVASALVPIVTMIEYRSRVSYVGSETVTVPETFVSVPAAIAVLAAPLFFLVLFSFLQKRTQSDFFHAIPYTRTCVYVSFLASALASIFTIQAIAVAVAVPLWCMIPHYTVNIGATVGILGCYFLASAMLSAFMMLALTVSGTGGSCTLLFFLFASLTRIVLAIFVMLLNEIPVLCHTYWMDASPLSPLWFYPLSAVSSGLMDTECLNSFLYNPADILYSVGVTLVLFAVSGVLYNRRHSEMAGNPAPGTKTQTLFRVLFTLPMALLTVALFVTESSDQSVLLVCSVCTLLCYFLYELITTKRPKNMLKALSRIWIVLAACLAFGLSYVGVQSYMRNEPVAAEDITSVTMPMYVLADEYSYNETVTVTDPEMLAILGDAYVESRTSDPNGRSYEVTIDLKDGRKLYRRITVDDKAQANLSERFFSLDEEITTVGVPDIEDVKSLEAEVHFTNSHSFWFDIDLSNGEASEVLSLFKAEFAALTSKEKIEMLSYSSSRESGVTLDIRTADQVRRFHIHGDNCPKTTAYLLGVYTNARDNGLIVNDLTVEASSAKDVLKRTVEMIDASEKVSDVTLSFFAQSIDGKILVARDTYPIPSERLSDILTFLYEHELTITPTLAEEEIPVPGGDSQILYLYVAYDWTVDGDTTVYGYASPAIEGSEADIARLLEWVEGSPVGD